MIIVIKQNAEQDKINALTTRLEAFGFEILVSKNTSSTILTILGDTSTFDTDLIKPVSIIETINRIQDPYKNAGRKHHSSDSIIDAGGIKLGGGNFHVIAGPCAVESKTQICEISRRIKASGANMLRGGAFKPRTSPYAFQGLQDKGIEYLIEAKKLTGLPVVSEILSESQLPLFDDVDIIQVGARNMQNYALLKELGKIKKPVLLKRGFSNTIEELLLSAEYIMLGGNANVILCERGIRTFENSTRNTLDISAIPIIKLKSHLPVIVDPSHASGSALLIEPLSLAAVAAGADGLMIEVHSDPELSMSDGAQALTPAQFDKVMDSILKLKQFCRDLTRA